MSDIDQIEFYCRRSLKHKTLPFFFQEILLLTFFKNINNNSNNNNIHILFCIYSSFFHFTFIILRSVKLIKTIDQFEK